MTDSSLEPAKLLDLAVALAHEAGALSLEKQRSGLRVSTKSTPTDVVTEADTAAEALLVRGIRQARPADGVLGEEGTSSAGSSGLRWVIDPIDGTVNYLYGLSEWSVSVAVEDDRGSVVGVVHVPSREETFWAVRGGGAFRDGEAVRPSACTDVTQTLLATGFGYDARRRVEQARWVGEVLPRIRDIRRFGSAAIDLCSVACGRVDAFAEQGLSPWDGAAGGLIASEAGAVVGGLGGAPAGPTLFVATAPGIWNDLHDLLISVRADTDPLA